MKTSRMGPSWTSGTRIGSSDSDEVGSHLNVRPGEDSPDLAGFQIGRGVPQDGAVPQQPPPVDQEESLLECLERQGAR